MTELETVLSKLRIKSGLRASPRLTIEDPWRVSFVYDRERKTFAIELHFGPRSTRMGLAREDVETRGRSPWMTDNTWRLSAAGLAKVEGEISKFMLTHAARAAEARKA